jgi:hypothetical protein
MYRFPILAALSVVVFFFARETSLEDEKSAKDQVWDFDSLAPESKSSGSDRPSFEVYQLLKDNLDRWNGHDIDAYLSTFWESPKLLFLSDSEVCSGWQELHDAYKRNFSDLSAMGTGTLSRVKIRIVRPDLAVALSYWTMSFPKSTHIIVGIDTDLVEKFENGWKIIVAHSTTAEM